MLKAKGAKYYIQGGSYGTFGSDTWTLLYNSSYSTESNLKVGFTVCYAAGQAMTMDDVSVIDSGLTNTPPLAFQNVMIQNPTSNSETIVVKTSINTDVTIDYGLTTAYGSTATSANQTIHKVLISGLNPETTYHYRVTAAETGNPTNTITKTDSTFKTQLAAGNNFVFGVVSDTQHYNWQTVASQLLTLNPDLLLTAGDNTEGSLADDDETLAFRWNWDVFDYSQNLSNHIPFFTSLGNHDLSPADELTVYSQEFSLPNGAYAEKYYSFDYGDVHFVSLNTLTTTVSQTQLDYLDADLAATTQKWKIVVLHMPGKNPSMVSNLVAASANALHTIYQNRGVQLVINGHSHVYHRWIKDGIFYVTNTTPATGGTGTAWSNATGDAGSLGSSIGMTGYTVGTVTPSQFTISSYDSTGVLQDTFNVAPNNFEVSSPANNSYTTNTSPTLAWNATTQTDAYAVPPLALSKYQLYVDGVLNRDSISTGDTSTTPTSALSNGSHTWYVDAVNNASKTQQSTSTYTINIDTTAPSVPGTPSTTTPTSNNKPAWTWTASTDSGSGLATTPYSVGWCGNSGFTGCDANTSTSTTNSFTHSTSLADGTWYFRVNATDAVGNDSSYSSNGTVIIDTTTQNTSTTTSTTTTSSSITTPSCGDQAPGAKAPWLYGAIAQDSSSVLLYFTPSDNPVNKYVLEYGTKSGDYPYGVQDMGVNARGQMTFLVKSLSPNTTYYFKVRGGNGCATGSWSNEISAKTKPIFSTNNLDIVSSELTVISNPTPTPTQTPTKKVDTKATATPTPTKTEIIPPVSGYEVKVKIIDTNKKPVEGAKVTIHSKVQETITNKEGIAEFKNVEAGNHRVLIAYKNFEGEQSVNLTGDVKEFDLNITVSQKAILLSPLAYGIIGIMGLVIIALVVVIIKTKRKT